MAVACKPSISARRAAVASCLPRACSMARSCTPAVRDSSLSVDLSNTHRPEVEPTVAAATAIYKDAEEVPMP